MAANPFTFFIFDLFIIAAILITAYTCNFYYLVFLSSRRKETYPTGIFDAPTITIQLPIYNEKYVAARLVDAVCAMDYPKEKMKIMVLDDSNDETVELLENLVNQHKKNGYDIVHVRRGNRTGYKAGAYDIEGFTGGMGFTYEFNNMQLGLDIAYGSISEGFDDTTRFALFFGF